MADQRIQLPVYSKFAKTPVYEVSTEQGAAVVFGLMQDVIVPDPSDVSYTVPVGMLYRFDLISQNFYGVPYLGWVLARVNGILDEMVGPPLGAVLRIPTKTRLAKEGLLNV